MNYAKAVRGTMQEMFGGMEHWADSHAPLGNGPRRQEELQGSIAVDAYYAAAERRNFQPGHELEDWLDAEAEVLAEREKLKPNSLRTLGDA